MTSWGRAVTESRALGDGIRRSRSMDDVPCTVMFPAHTRNAGIVVLVVIGPLIASAQADAALHPSNHLLISSMISNFFLSQKDSPFLSVSSISYSIL